MAVDAPKRYPCFICEICGFLTFRSQCVGLLILPSQFHRPKHESLCCLFVIHVFESARRKKCESFCYKRLVVAS